MGRLLIGSLSSDSSHPIVIGHINHIPNVLVGGKNHVIGNLNLVLLTISLIVITETHSKSDVNLKRNFNRPAGPHHMQQRRRDWRS